MLEEEIRRRNTLDLMGRVAGYAVSRDAWENNLNIIWKKQIFYVGLQRNNLRSINGCMMFI